MINPFKKGEDKVYKLYHNNNYIDIKVMRIKIGGEYYKNLIKTKRFSNNFGYFIYNIKGFNSLLMYEKIDLIFVRNDKQIIKTYSNFNTNKISDFFKETKFVYILPQNTIVRNNIKEGDYIKHVIFNK